MADAHFNADPSRSKRELLAEIKSEAETGLRHGYVGFVVPAFAALLVKLSEEADATAQRVVRLTRWLIFLTIVLAILTALLLAEGAKQFVDDYAQADKNAGQAAQHEQVKRLAPSEPVQKSAPAKRNANPG